MTYDHKVGYIIKVIQRLIVAKIYISNFSFSVLNDMEEFLSTSLK